MRAVILALLLLFAVTSARLTVREIRSALYGVETAPQAKSFTGAESLSSSQRVAVVVGQESSKLFRSTASILAQSNEVVVISVGSDSDFEQHVIECDVSRDPLMTSYNVFKALQEVEGLDAIYFETWNGLGYMTTQAKKDGLAFLSTRLVTVLSRNHDKGSAAASPETLVTIFMERKSVEMSDFVATANELQCEQLANKGWVFPSNLYSVATWKPNTLAKFVQHTGTLSAVVVPASTQPKVSIVIPTYNRGPLLAKAVESVKQQSYPNVEIVVVDDGSTDAESIAYLKTLEVNDVKVIRQKNLYLGAARNSGVKHASGKYIFFLDDDNELLPGLLNKVVTAAETSDSPIVVNGHWKGKTLEDAKLWMPLGAAKMAGLTGDFFASANFLIEKTVFNKLGGFSTERLPYEDYEFHAKASLAGVKYAVVPEALLFYRQHSASQMANSADALAHQRALRSYSDVLPSDAISSAQKKDVAQCKDLEVTFVVCLPCELYTFQAILVDNPAVGEPLYNSDGTTTLMDGEIRVQFQDNDNAANTVDTKASIRSVSPLIVGGEVVENNFVVVFNAAPFLISSSESNLFETPASWKVTSVFVRQSVNQVPCTFSGAEPVVAACGYNSLTNSANAIGMSLSGGEHIAGGGLGAPTDGLCCCVTPGALPDGDTQCCVDFVNKNYCADFLGGTCDDDTKKCACRFADDSLSERGIDECFNLGGACKFGAVAGIGGVDTEISVQDLVALITAWGPCDCAGNEQGATAQSRCLSDANKDGIINVQDLVSLIARWGPLNPQADPDTCCCYAADAVLGDCCTEKSQTECNDMGMSCEAPSADTRCCCEAVLSGGSLTCFDSARADCEEMSLTSTILQGCRA